MKPRILINSRNLTLVADFLQHTETFFDAVSTANTLEDVVAHFKLFQPNIYVIYAETSYEQTVQQLNSLKENDYFNGAVIVIVGDADLCTQFERKSKDAVDLIVRRPVSTDNLALRINRYLDDNGDGVPGKSAISQKTAQADALIMAAEAALSQASAAAPAPAAAAPAAAPGRRHILVVDDDRTVLKMVKSALESGYDVTTMAGGSMVDKLLAAKKVDLIILDYEMPIETGADVFRRLKKNPKAASIPVCFLTGVSDRQKIMEVMSLKPHGYILKPIDMDMLTATIKNLIG